MAREMANTESKNIIIIGMVQYGQPTACSFRSPLHTGAGIIGCSTAYFLTRHAFYDPKIHSIIILEATEIGGGSSGKAGGLLADWATPKCLAPLSFKTHAALAKKQGGENIWGYRNVHCAEVELQAQDLDDKGGLFNGAESAKFPSELDWLLPGSLKSYEELGTPSNCSQVNPYMLTKTLAALAEEKGAKIIIGSATAIDFKEDGQGIKSVQYTQNGTTKSMSATDILLSAGPWTPKLFPQVQLKTPRGHSVVVKPSRNVSPYVLFPKIAPPPNGNLEQILSPEIYPRPGDRLSIPDQGIDCTTSTLYILAAPMTMTFPYRIPATPWPSTRNPAMTSGPPSEASPKRYMMVM